eukprot:gene951-31695_t
MLKTIIARMHVSKIFHHARNVAIRGMSTSGDPRDPDQADLDNHANQCNPNNAEHQGCDDDDDDYYHVEDNQADLDNHSNQCNPNNDAYWDSRK